MGLTQAPRDEAAAAAAARHDLVVALADASIYVETHLHARMPESPVCNVRVRGATYKEKIDDLKAIAASWNAEVTPLPDGTQYTELVFGPVTFEAHVPPADTSTLTWLRQRRGERGAAA